MRTGLVALAAFIGLITIDGSAGAHHAFSSIFDPANPLELSGTVTKVEWMNPHIWFYLDVENEDGSVQNWGFEMGSPNTLIRRGWSHDSLKVGEVVSIEGWRARDGTMRGAVKSIMLASGQRLFGGQNTNR